MEPLAGIARGQRTREWIYNKRSYGAGKLRDWLENVKLFAIKMDITLLESRGSAQEEGQEEGQEGGQEGGEDYGSRNP
jgi:hypothetical protein